MFQQTQSSEGDKAQFPRRCDRRCTAPSPKQYFGLLPTELAPVPDYDGLRYTRLLAEMRKKAELPEDEQLARATKLLRAENLGIRQLAEVAAQALGRAQSTAAIFNADDVERAAAIHIWTAGLILASRAKVANYREAYYRIELLASNFGALPEKYRGGASRRVSRDMRAIICGDRHRLPIPVNTRDAVKFDSYIPVPAYCVGERYERDDRLLLTQKPEVVVGAEYVLRPWSGDEGGWLDPGYEGVPPQWMVGQMIGATRRHWMIRTAAPHEHVWRLPKRGWGLEGRVIGYQRGDQFVRRDH